MLTSRDAFVLSVPSQFSNSSFRATERQKPFFSLVGGNIERVNLKEIEGNIAANTFPLFLVEDASPPPPPPIENNPLTPPSKLDPPRVVA